MLKLFIGEKEVEIGMEVESFRGEKMVVRGWREPHKPSSTGRVYVTTEGSAYQREYYPGVIKAEWKEV